MMSQLRFLVAIPTYNDETTINQVIADVLQLTNLPILIIDDGSENNVEEFVKRNIPANQRLNFLRLEKNQGQGAALQAGFAFAVQKNFTHLIATDAGGENKSFEISLLTSAAKRNPFSLIVGCRKAVDSTEPESNKFSMRLANFWNKLWAKYQTDAKVVDAQSGFRCYPLFFMQNMTFKFKRFDFEIEVLIRSIWNGIDIKNIKTSVVYDPHSPSKHTSGNLKDSLKMMVLRATLVVVSLITEPTSPFQSAFAVAIGVFVGVLPIFGLHAAIVAAISIAFRMNFIYLWLGTHISTPPFIPFILYGSNLIGKKFFDYFYHQQSGLIFTTVIGSVILGFILAAIAFILVYLIKRKISLKEKNLLKNGRPQEQNSKALLFLNQNRSFVFLKKLTPAVAVYIYLSSFKTRNAGKQYWDLVKPKIGFFETQKHIYRQILVDLQCQAQALASPKYSAKELDDQRNKAVITKGQGSIVISGHIGNYRQLHFHTESSKTLLLIDQCFLKRFELVLFLKKLAPFDSTPFRMALAYNLPIEFLFIIHQEGTNSKVCSFYPILKEKISYEQEVHDLLNQYIMILENLLKIHPHQWFNFYPFWSTAPHRLEKLSTEISFSE